MTKQAHKYDGIHFQVVTMNMRDGSVQGHIHGCADLKRGVKKFAEPSQADDFMDVETKADAWLDYNSDFLAEGGPDNAYDIQWLPCAKAVPEGDTQAAYEAAFGEEHTPVAYQSEVVTAETTVTVKRGPKWTYIFVNGEQVMEVRSHLADQVLATVNFG